jgi:hypothetical protein
MRSSNKKAIVLAITGLLSFNMTTYRASAGGGGVIDNSTSIPSSTQTITPNTSTPSTLTTPTTQYNQSGLQVNWSGSSTLNPPNCNGGCVFAVTKISPTTYGSGTNMEAIVGITLPIGSNDNGTGEVNRINAEMQKYRTENETKIALSEKLAEALENGKMERAKVIAIILFPLLGYKDYQSLLRAVSNK